MSIRKWITTHKRNQLHSFFKIVLVAHLLLSVTGIALANEPGYDNPNDHAPIGVMRDHVHDAGEVMLSYRYGYMNMPHNLIGNKLVSTEAILQRYSIVPTSMTAQMHMFGLMVGILDNITITAMTLYTEREMDIQFLEIELPTLETKGIGDTRLDFMYKPFASHKHHLQLNLGLSFPTGSIDEKNNGLPLPYPMQLGSGTYDLLPGISYSGFYDIFSWGGQFNAVARLHKNKNGYKLGHRYQITFWGSTRITSFLSTSLRLDVHIWERIEGIDKNLPAQSTIGTNGFPTPTADPNLQGGQRLDLLMGLNFIVPGAWFSSSDSISKKLISNNRLSLEFGGTLYQDIDGPRLGSGFIVVVGWQKAF